VAFARNDKKLVIAKENSADRVIYTRGKALADIRKELLKATDHSEIDAVID
jgi:propanol-preferring alcohol dehydrogenase